MNEQLNRRAVNTIIRHIPENQNPTEYIMDILDLGKDSIYRRLNGKIPFTFEELVKLSDKLNFSIDAIYKKDNNINHQMMNEAENFSPSALLINKLQTYYDLKKRFIDDINNFYSTVSYNKLYILLLTRYENLFKFFYYRWIYQIDNQSILFSFSDLKMPNELIELREKLSHVVYQNNESSYIIDPNALSNTVNDIQYFYKRELITKEELMILKEELINMELYYESFYKTGSNEYNSSINIFISTVNIDSNIICIEHKETKMAICWYNQTCPAFEYDPEKVTEYKIWLESLKKFSILISKSNYEYAAAFIKNQMDSIMNIGNI